MYKYHKKLEISSFQYLKKDFDSIVPKSPMDVGRTNLFQIDIPTTGPPTPCALYQIPLKYQNSSMGKFGYTMQDAYLKA